jgi:lipopolysaccharide transport system permease protein
MNEDSTSSPSVPHTLVIEAGRAQRHYWADLWRYRDLLGFLAWRDVKVRYQQTILGAAWAIVQPLASVAIFTFVFGRLAKMPSGGEPYFVVVMAGQLAWQLFANSLSNTSGSLVGNSHLIAKVYFPRLAVPLSTIAVALVDFLILLVLYAIAVMWTGTVPTINVVLLPVFITLALVLALGAGLWLAALTVRFRDFRIVVPFLLQIGVFATPVGYRTDSLTTWQPVLDLNPMTGVVDAFRWCLLSEGTAFHWNSMAFSLVWAVLLIITGVWYFRRTERSFADVI